MEESILFSILCTQRMKTEVSRTERIRGSTNRVSSAYRIKNQEEALKNYQNKIERTNEWKASNQFHIMPEIRVQELINVRPNHTEKRGKSTVYERRRKNKDVSQEYLIVSKKKLSNSPNTHLITKHEKMYQMKRKTTQDNVQALRNVVLAQQDLLLCSQLVSDENRLTKLNVEWLKNDERARDYQSNRFQKDLTSTVHKHPISYGETEIRAYQNEREDIDAQRIHLGLEPIVE